MEPMVVQRAIENNLYGSMPPEIKTKKLVYSLKYFKEICYLKRLIH